MIANQLGASVTGHDVQQRPFRFLQEVVEAFGARRQRHEQEAADRFLPRPGQRIVFLVATGDEFALMGAADTLDPFVDQPPMIEAFEVGTVARWLYIGRGAAVVAGVSKSP